jgi:effector-binding domain-containing protein
MGISPKNIKVILDKKDNSMLLDFLKNQGESIDIKIEELQRSRAIIKMVNDNISSSLASISNKEPFYENIPSRNIITVKLETTDEDIPLCYSRLYQLVDKLKLTSTYETGIIYSADGESAFYPTEVFNAVIEDTCESKKGITKLPAGRYLCICFNMQNAEEQQRKFNQYLAQNQLNPELILQVDLMNNVFDEGATYMELQALLEREA